MSNVSVLFSAPKLRIVWLTASFGAGPVPPPPQAAKRSSRTSPTAAVPKRLRTRCVRIRLPPWTFLVEVKPGPDAAERCSAALTKALAARRARPGPGALAPPPPRRPHRLLDHHRMARQRRPLSVGVRKFRPHDVHARQHDAPRIVGAVPEGDVTAGFTVAVHQRRNLPAVQREHRHRHPPGRRQRELDALGFL